MNLQLGKSLKIGFMYNHETSHQVAHTAPILKELIKRHPAFPIDVLTSTDEQEELVRHCLTKKQQSKTRFVKLRRGKPNSKIINIAKKVSPVSRLWNLKLNLDILEHYDVLVVPEWTSLMLKSRFGLKHLKLIFTHHGAGDRAVTYNENIKDFDFVLLPGRKFEKVHFEKDLIRRGDYAVIGYPKFDFVAADQKQQSKTFSNGNPTVLYNPHFDPHLSSWYEMGLEILSRFKEKPDLNLIFAPHVMLFERRVHTSLEHRQIKWVKSLPEKFMNCPNIHIDLGSRKSVDMSYSREADIYLGDVSSQVYEFIEKRRPCIFLNVHNAQWQKNPFYKHWNLGPVLDDVADVIPAITNAEIRHQEYEDAQDVAFTDTFELNDEESSIRAANAIADYLSRIAFTDAYTIAAE